MRHWLMKSEPSDFSIDDLRRRKRTSWTGVRNYKARNFMRDTMNIGDLIIFYHSSAKIIGAAGVAKVVSSPYPDPTQFNKTDTYYDPRATKERPIWYLVDVAFVKKFPRIVTRSALATCHRLSRMQLWKYPRLSIVPLSAHEFHAILELASSTHNV